MLRSHTVRRAAIAVAATVAVAGVLAAASLGALASATHTLTGTVVSTALSSSSVAVGGAGVHDTATLSGLTGSTFTGDTVTYTVYPSESSCTSGSGGTSEGSVTVSGNGPAAPSNAFAPTSTGTYYWQATFNGADKTNAAASSDCSSEPLTVDGVTTALSSSSATVGGAGVHDTATLSGLTGSTFTGDTVTYTVYPSQSSCTSGSGGTSEGSVTVSGNGPAAPSNTFAPTSTGTYYWQATFNGADKTNAAANSDCLSEALTAAAPTVPTVTTALSSSSVAVGGAGIQDTATLSGLTGSTFTGDTVTYTVYPSQSSCTSGSGGTSEGSVTVSGNGPAAPSNAFAPTSTGTYYWQATFNGADKTNAAASSDCSSEALTVYQTAPVPQRGKGGSLVCHRLRIGRGRHHHAVWICFRVRPPRFHDQGQGNGRGQGQYQDDSGRAGGERRYGIARDRRH